MSKSVLVIDTPKSCFECSFCYINWYEDGRGIAYCGLNQDYIDNEYNAGIKSDRCPLSPLPSSISLKQYVDNAELNMESMLACQYAQGWNEYRNEILKGDT